MGAIERDFQNNIPPPRILRSLRTGKLKPLGDLSILSGIDKKPCKGRVYVNNLGLTDDEHDLTFHGGIDKAIHQYCSDHYPLWKSMFPSPEVAARFSPGAFGENLVVDGFNESNICIGDLVRIGPANSIITGGDNGVLLQVSIPRQPCFKLNQRFGLKGFAGKTHELNRTGWYYRVVEEGWLEEEMEVRIVERRNPKWTIEKVHHHVHRDRENRQEIEEALSIPDMGAEAKRYLKGNLEKMEKAEKEKAAGPKPKEVWKPYKVTEKHMETRRIASLQLSALHQSDEPEPIPPASYCRLKLPDGLIRSYSVVGGTFNSFTLGIALGEPSRGGSSYIHNTLQNGELLEVGNFAADLPPDMSGASNHIFLVGGIGITAFLALVQKMHKINYNYDFHYAVRSAEEVAFRNILDTLGDHIKIYDGSKAQRMPIRPLLADRKWNSLVYACGPGKLMDSIKSLATELDMTAEEIHFEAFSSDLTGDPFTTSVSGREGNLEVGGEQTLLEVLRKAGMDVQSSCEVGNCGTCRVGIKSGQVEHRGTGLADLEKKKYMLACCSRGVGHVEVELDD